MSVYGQLLAHTMTCCLVPLTVLYFIIILCFTYDDDMMTKLENEPLAVDERPWHI